MMTPFLGFGGMAGLAPWIQCILVTLRLGFLGFLPRISVE